MKTNYHSFDTSMGQVRAMHLAHGSALLEWNGKKIYVDPYSDVYDYTECSKADLILLTHAHTDHYDNKALKEIATANTVFVVSKGVETCLRHDLEAYMNQGIPTNGTEEPLNLDDNPLNVDPSTNLENMFAKLPELNSCTVKVLANGESCAINFASTPATVGNAAGQTLGAGSTLVISAVPAYNIVRKRDNGNPFHLKGEGNGYIIDLQGFKIYFAGDTEIIPEMNALTPEKLGNSIDVAFLPKNLPYTLSDEEFIQAANLIRPKNLFPIHYFELDGQKLESQIDKSIKLIY